MTSPTQEEVRDHVREEQASLRELVQGVRASLCVDASEAPPWRPTFELCEALERYLDYEDAVVVPLLADADAWGPIRVARLDDEHRAQRSMIAALREDIGSGARSVPELVEEIRWFASALERDLAEEARLVLDADVLHDEPVVTDQTDG